MLRRADLREEDKDGHSREPRRRQGFLHTPNFNALTPYTEKFCYEETIV
jgi:hypothetical protein